MIKKIIFLIILFFSFQVPNAFAEESYIVEPDENKLEEIVLEKKLEERLHQDINSYLGHSKFILKIDVDLIKIKKISKEPVHPPAPPSIDIPSVSPPIPQRKTEQTQSPSNFLMKEEELDQLIEIPGIPVQREILGKNDQTPSPEKTNPPLPIQEYSPLPAKPSPPELVEKIIEISLKIKQIAVTLITNEDITGEEEEFIKNIVFQKTHLDATRGDLFKLIKTKFPTPKTDEIKKIEAAPKPPEKIPEPVTPAPVPEVKVTPPSLLKSLPAHYILFIIILVFILILFFLFKKIKNNAPSLVPVGVMTKQGSGMAALEKIETNFGKTMEDIKKEINSKEKIEHIKQEIVTLALSHPDLISKIVKDETMQQEGNKHLASVFRALGFHLAKNVFSSLSGEDLVSIEKYLEIDEDIDEKEIIKNLEAFYYKLYYHRLLHQEEKKTTPFKFLDKLDESQIAYLINEEDVRVQALIISQLSAERATLVIKKIPVEKQAPIMSELGKFESFPLSLFHEVADRLSSKSLTVPSFTNIPADGINILINIFDHFDVVTEKEMFEKIKIQNPEMYYRLRKEFFTFPDIVKIPDEILKEILRETNKETISLSLINAEEGIISKVINNLPERVRIMVTDNLTELSQSNNAPSDKIDTARREIANKIRLLIKAGKISLA